MLRPWQVNISPVSASGILDKQLHRWTDFRKWQTDHRGLVEDDGGFPAYVEEEKQAVQRCLRPKAAAKRLAEIEADPACLKQSWEDQKWRRERQLRHVRERGCKGFPDYVQAVKSRLARHDFTQPFELDEKPEKQDKLTTWIEYLNYEYWWLDKHRSDIQRHEPRRDELWRDLVSKNVLRPYETEEYLRTDASPLEREAEKDQARQAVERAEAEGLRVHALTQKDPNRLTIPKATRVSMLKQATAAVIAAKQRLEQVEARSEPITQFIRGTFGYTGAKREAWRQGLLVQWVRDQVPLIEKEMGLSKSSRSGSGRTRTTPKRRRDADQEGSSEKRDSKRARVSSARKTRSKATEPQPVPDVAPQSKASRRSQPDDPANGHADKHRDTPKPPAPRRSARIAARQKAGCQDDDGQDAGHAPRTRSRPRRGATEQSSKTQPAPKKSKTEKPAKKADKLKKTATQQSTDTSEPARRSRRRR